MAVETRTATVLPHREDHVGATRRPVLIAAGLTFLALITAIPMALTISRPAGVWGLVVLGFVIFTLAAASVWFLVYTGWVVSVEITEDVLRYGALTKADRRASRGIGTYGAKPYATWLYEYRCPIPALRGIWLVGAGDAMNPERAHPELFGGGRVAARYGWIRMPFVGGGLLFEFDSRLAAMPDFGSMWRSFHTLPANSVLRRGSIWYAPVADPERCRAALVDALMLNGFEVDAQGAVRQVPGRAPRREGAVYVPRAPARAPGPRHGDLSIALSIVWAVLPLLTLGYLTWAVYGYAALRIREMHAVLIALMWLVLDAAYWWVTSTMGGGNPSTGPIFAGLLSLLALGGTIFAFVMRKDVFYYH